MAEKMSKPTQRYRSRVFVARLGFGFANRRIRIVGFRREHSTMLLSPSPEILKRVERFTEVIVPRFSLGRSTVEQFPILCGRNLPSLLESAKDIGGTQYLHQSCNHTALHSAMLPPAGASRWRGQ